MAAVEKEKLYSPKHVSLRRLPQNFNEKDISLFKHELEKEIPAVKTLEFEDVKVSAEGVIFYKNKILIESFAFPVNFRKWKKRAIIKTYVNNFILRKNRRIDGDVFWATDDWSAGYFHWLCDVLPRLAVISDELKNGVLLLPHGFSELDYVQNSLEILGVKDVEYIKENEVVGCRRLYLPTHTAASGDFNERIIKKVRRLFLEKFNTAAHFQSAQRVYISRRNASKRSILNEEEILDTLENHGFSVICAEDYSFIEQVKLFRSVKYLISSHGAGLTNMLFTPEGSSVFELRKYDDKINNCYFNMSSALGIDFYYQLCGSDRMDEDAHTANLIVDKTALADNLNRFLENK